MRALTPPRCCLFCSALPLAAARVVGGPHGWCISGPDSPTADPAFLDGTAPPYKAVIAQRWCVGAPAFGPRASTPQAHTHAHGSSLSASAGFPGQCRHAVALGASLCTLPHAVIKLIASQTLTLPKACPWDAFGKDAEMENRSREHQIGEHVRLICICISK